MIAFVHGMAVDMTESSVVVEAGGIVIWPLQKY